MLDASPDIIHQLQQPKSIYKEQRIQNLIKKKKEKKILV